MRNMMLALGMLLVVTLGGCGGPEDEVVPETGQEVEALTLDSKSVPCGWTTIYYEWQCGPTGWDKAVVATSGLDCHGNFTEPDEATDCYLYYEYPCNSANPCYDEVFECPPRPLRLCRPLPTFPGSSWQFLAP